MVHLTENREIYIPHLGNCDSDDKYFQLTVQDMIDCVCKQKMDKAAGLDEYPWRLLCMVVPRCLFTCVCCLTYF